MNKKTVKKGLLPYLFIGIFMLGVLFFLNIANQKVNVLTFDSFMKQVKEKNGSAYYIFFWDHIYRSIGSMSRYTDWLSFAPYYTMDGEKLIRKKMFTNGRPFISRIYEEIYQSSACRADVTCISGLWWRRSDDNSGRRSRWWRESQSLCCLFR